MNKNNKLKPNIPESNDRIIGDVIGTTGQLLSNVVEGGLQIAANKEAEEQAMRIAELNKEQYLSDFIRNYKLNKYKMEANKEQNEREKFIEQMNLRYNYLEYKIKKILENRKAIYNNFINIKNEILNNKAIRNKLIDIAIGKNK